MDIKGFITHEGIESIKMQGAWLFDSDNDRVTPLIKAKECAYTVFENGIARCGIENAWKAGKTTFRKPISCHLYPIRVNSEW